MLIGSYYNLFFEGCLNCTGYLDLNVRWDVEDSDHCLILPSRPTIWWRNWGKPVKYSVRIADIMTENRTRIQSRKSVEYNPAILTYIYNAKLYLNQLSILGN